MFNLSGSIKDRMALNILRKAYERGTLRPGQPIAEATSGHTGQPIEHVQTCALPLAFSNGPR